jgi:hypothetical protein
MGIGLDVAILRNAASLRLFPVPCFLFSAVRPFFTHLYVPAKVLNTPLSFNMFASESSPQRSKHHA